MAQGVRPRAAIAVVALAFAGCGGGRRTPQAPAPRAVDTAAVADDVLVAAVLDECHKPLRGHMDRVSAVVTLPDGSEHQLFAQLPDKMRVQNAANAGNAGNERLLLVGDDVERIDGDAAVAPADAARVRALRTLLDAAALGPLHRATGCRRLSATTFELQQPAGAPVTLALRAGTLLPDALTIGGATVRIVDFVPQPVTWIPRTVELDGLGRCTVRFSDASIAFADDFFRRPQETTRARPRLAGPGGTRESRPRTPTTAEGKASRWVVLADPGDWPGRTAACAPVYAELTRQQQQAFGFPYLWQQDGKRWLAVPFRARDGAKELVAPAGWTIRDVPAVKVLEVFPPEGDLAARIAAGERLLQDALQAKGLTAAGPIAAQPYVHLDEGEPPAKTLASPVVRMSVPLR